MAPDEPAADPVSAATEERLRGLLAEARVTEPVPADVAARLDATLGELVAARADAAATGPSGIVVDLAARRRRRRAAGLLGAAAAVTVLGFGVSTFVSGDGSDDDASSEDMLGADVDRGSDGELAPTVASDDAKAAEESDPADVTRTDDAAERISITIDGPAARIRPERLVADLVALRDVALPPRVTADYDRTLVAEPPGFMCDTAAWGPGILVGVRYDGAPAVAAFREPVGDTQVVEVLRCGTGDALRSVTVPAAE